MKGGQYRTVVADPPWHYDATGVNFHRADYRHPQYEAFMDIVESVSPDPRLEMFSRRARLGWDTWGNESLHGGAA